MTKGLVALLFACLAFFSLTAQSEEQEIILSYKVKTHPLQMMKIASQFEVVKKLSDGFEVYVLRKDLNQFLKLAPQATLLKSNIHSQSIEKASQQYRKFADVENDLKSLNQRFPNFTSLENYGKSKEGRNLYVLKIKNISRNQVSKKILLTAATHGDELITTEVLFILTMELLEGLNKNDPRFLKMVEGKELSIIPVVSPDSFERRNRYVQNVDPNRSYPWPDSPNNKSVDVISALMDLFQRENYSATLDMHAYGRLVMYPWGYTRTPPPQSDEVVMKDMVESMAKNTAGDTSYEAGQISTTIYVAKGSSADYYYWKNKSKALAIEIGQEKVPNFKEIPKIVLEVKEMIWTFIELN